MLLLPVPSSTRVLARAISFRPKVLYNPKAFFTHAAWLDQGCPHCPKFPTAASRRSLGRVSVPVWLVVLSDQLRIVALVGLLPHQLANPASAAPLAQGLAVPCFHLSISCGISQSFDWLSPTRGHVPMHYSPVRRSPPGLPPRCRSTCMCKACRQRSI